MIGRGPDGLILNIERRPCWLACRLATRLDETHWRFTREEVENRKGRRRVRRSIWVQVFRALCIHWSFKIVLHNRTVTQLRPVIGRPLSLFALVITVCIRVIGRVAPIHIHTLFPFLFFYETATTQAKHPPVSSTISATLGRDAQVTHSQSRRLDFTR